MQPYEHKILFYHSRLFTVSLFCAKSNLCSVKIWFLTHSFFWKWVFFSWRVEGSIFDVFPQSLNVTDLQSCSSTTDPWQPCACSYRLNLEWFPCQLKYCRGQGPNPYKCGIKSCSKGYRFDFYTPHKQLCLWDEDN